MKRLLSCAVLLASVSAVHAAPFVVSDPSAQPVTHCGIVMDGKAPVVMPVDVTPTGGRCKYDLAPLAPGKHTMTATFIVESDPLWGRQESKPSIPFTFVKPSGAILGEPVGFSIVKE